MPAETAARSAPALPALASRTWDVMVIGAGPAGCSAAIASARAGLQVLLVDAKRFPRRKVCGGCLNRKSLGLLRDLLGAEHSFWAQSITLNRFQLTHRRQLFEFSMAAGMAVDRAAMDQSLVEAAQQSGVTFQSAVTARLLNLDGETRQTELTAGGSTVIVAARAVVLASGLGGRSAGEHPTLQQTARPNSRVGIEAILEHFPAHYNAGAIHMVVGRHGYVGLTQISDRRLHVAAAVDRSALQRLGPAGLTQHILDEAGAPALSQTAVADWRGTPPLSCRASRLAAERVFLVGDAAGYVEPFTGEGIRWALQSGLGVAPLLVRSQASWQPDLELEWEAWYRAFINPEQRLCRQLASGLKRTSLRWVAHQALRARPKFASQIIDRLNRES